jgi:Tol biopolymer transport system component
VQAESVTAPVISGDRAWVAYRQVKANGNEVWAVPLSGGDARLLLAERDLSAGLPQGYRERRVQDVRWLPGKRVLVVTTQLTPAAQDAAPQLEMWTVDIASGARKLLASGDARPRPIIAPNGAQIAFFRLAPEKAGEGGLWLIGADGGGERAVLRFPARPDARSIDGQIAWLPDSSGFWAAIPDARQPSALTLYRLPLNGEAQMAGRVEGSEVFWSPNGARLAYTRLTGETAGPKEVYLAAADNTNPQLYATIASGRFIGWSPDSARFLYEDGGQLFVGAPGGKSQRLAANAGEPRWLGTSQIVYQAGQGDTRQWTIQAVDGKAIPLQTLPAGATVDSIRP